MESLLNGSMSTFFPVQEEIISMERLGHAPVYTVLFTPSGRDVQDLTILCHGLGANGDSMRAYAEGLAKRGHAAVIFDFTSGSPDSRSGGRMIEMSLRGEIEEFKQVYLFYRERIPDISLYAGGISQGGIIALQAAADLPDLKGLLLLAPAFVMPYAFKTRYPRFEDIEDSLELFSLTVGRAYLEDSWRLDFSKTVPSFPGPVLLIHGMEDKVASFTYTLDEAMRFQNARLLLLPHAHHTFRGDEITEIIVAADGFLRDDKA